MYIYKLELIRARTVLYQKKLISEYRGHDLQDLSKA